MPTTAAIQSDIRRSFQVEHLRTFRRDGAGIYAEVGHNPEIALVTDVWFGNFGDDQAFRDVLEYLAELFETGRYRIWLADLRFMGQSFGPSGDWLVEVLMPRVLAAGLEREAVVMPGNQGLPEGYDVFGAASEALQRLTDGRVRGYTDIGLAKRWLIEGLLPG